MHHSAPTQAPGQNKSSEKDQLANYKLFGAVLIGSILVAVLITLAQAGPG
jgi:hypothetical protein